MNDVSNHIRLVAGFEIRPPAGKCRFVFERDESRRLGGLVAEDLSHCVPEVTAGHLVTGPALLEPGQIISPDHAPWQAMARVSGLGAAPAPSAGITSIGAHLGQLAHAPLMPYWSPPRGLFLCLPILLAVEAAELDPLGSRLEQTLFESGGLRPPAMGTLADITGLDPVHGQMMTRTDLMALLKVQLAGAGLDPFWPPVEHALLEPKRAERLELPGGLVADWNVNAGGWELEFVPLHLAVVDPDEYALWLRALRQTTALLESHLVRWRATSGSGRRFRPLHAGWSHASEPGVTPAVRWSGATRAATARIRPDPRRRGEAARIQVPSRRHSRSSPPPARRAIPAARHASARAARAPRAARTGRVRRRQAGP